VTLTGISTTKIVWFCESIMELHIFENCIIFLSVDNSLVPHAGLHNTLLCVLLKAHAKSIIGLFAVAVTR